MENTGNVIPIPPNSSSKLGTHLHFILWYGTPYKNGNKINFYNN